MSYISLESFNENYQVIVMGIEEAHIDESEFEGPAVGFSVMNKTNRRTLYFEKHIPAERIPNPGYTHMDLVNVAWELIKERVFEWATSVLNLPSIIGSEYIPNNIPGNVNILLVNEAYTVTVDRLEPYPPVNSKGYYIGFKITNKDTGKNNFVYATKIYTTLDFTVTEAQILDDAWEYVKDAAAAWIAEDYALSNVIGLVYVPTSAVEQ